MRKQTAFFLALVGVVGAWLFWSSYTPGRSLLLSNHRSELSPSSESHPLDSNTRVDRGNEHPEESNWDSKLKGLLSSLKSSVETEKLVLEWLPSLSETEMREMLNSWLRGEIELPSGAAGSIIFKHLGRNLGLSTLLSIDESLINASQRSALISFATGAAERNPWECARQIAAIRNQVLRSSCADALINVANTLEFPEALKLIELVGTDVSYHTTAASSITKRWFAGKDTLQTINSLSQFVSSTLPAEIKADLARQCIALSLRNAPAETMKMIEQFGTAVPDYSARGSMWATAVSVASSGQLDELRGALTASYENGDTAIAPSFQTIGKKLAKANDVYAANIIENTKNPDLADNLKFGFVQAVKSRDPEAASAWTLTIVNPNLRNELLKLNNAGPR